LNQETAKASAAGAAFEAHSADCTDPRLENNSNQTLSPAAGPAPAPTPADITH